MGHVIEGPINQSDKDILEKYLTDNELTFFQEYTNTPEDKLRDLARHVLSVWRSAVADLHGYGCIREFLFLKPGINLQSYYPLLHEINKEKKENGGQGATLCDVGGCFGTDIRKLLLDGFSDDQLALIDVHGDFWKLGLRLFGDERLPSNEEAPGSNFYPSPQMSISGIRTAFMSLTDPNFFKCHPDFEKTFDVVHAGLVLHVFDRRGIEHFFRGVKGLLKDNGFFFGWNVGVNDGLEGPWKEVMVPGTQNPRYLQSSASLCKLLEEEGFCEVSVNVNTTVRNLGFKGPIVPCDRELIFMSLKAKKT